MREYRPDRWVLVRIESEQYGVYYRFLAGWYGGFARGDSWKLSSGILEDQITVDADECFVCPQFSNSCYIVHPSAIGMSSYMHGVARSFEEDAENSDGQLKFEVLNKDVALEFLRGKQKKA